MKGPFLAVLVASALAGLCYGQLVPPSAAELAARRPSTGLLYHQFFKHLIAVQEKAAEVEKAGGRAESLKSVYKDKIGLAESDHTALLRRATACEQAVATQDDKASAFIRDYHSKLPKGKTPADFPVPGQISLLQIQRESIINDHVDALKAEISSQGSKKLDDFIKGEFAKRSSVQVIDPVRNSKLSNDRVALLRQQLETPTAATNTRKSRSNAGKIDIPE